MKFGIFVFVLVAVACHEAMCHSGPALLEGNCQVSDVPQSYLADCNRITCNKDSEGKISISAVTCSLLRCPDGTERGGGDYDLSKPYPECCRYECD